jgi:hypothetical protein
VALPTAKLPVVAMWYAERAVVPGTSHGLLVEKPALCNLLITEFLTKDPVETFAPIRRAARKTP